VTEEGRNARPLAPPALGEQARASQEGHGASQVAYQLAGGLAAAGPSRHGCEWLVEAGAGSAVRSKQRNGLGFEAGRVKQEKKGAGKEPAPPSELLRPKMPPSGGN